MRTGTKVEIIAAAAACSLGLVGLASMVSGNWPQAIVVIGLLTALSLAVIVYYVENLAVRVKETEEVNKELKSMQKLSVQTERTLRDAEKKTRLIVEKAYEGFIAVNPDGVIVEWNNQAEKIFGWSQAEAIGQNVTESITHPKYRSMLRHGLKDISDTGRQRLSNIRTEITALHKDGHEFPVEVAFFTVQIDGRLTFCAFLHDISERTRLNQQREDFVATLAHDLKTPILGGNRLLEHLLQGRLAVDTYEQKDVISKLLKSNENMLELIGTLLDVYRYEQGSKPLDFHDTDLLPLIKESIDQLKPLIESINLHLSVKDELPQYVVKADAGELRRCFQNILSNSIKFTPPGGKVEIKTTKRDNSVVIDFKDTGIGIPEEDLSKLFQRFWQGEPGRKYPSSTGLGLFLCHMIVEAHGGTISCHSELDSGTIFSVTLPLAAQVRLAKPDRQGRE